ncbi:alpha-N-acetylglucosaminidase-like isoform X1 [Haemaphysalis longicornis]
MTTRMLTPAVCAIVLLLGALHVDAARTASNGSAPWGPQPPAADASYSTADQQAAVEGLLRRLVPHWQSKITLHVFAGPKDQRQDMFVVDTFNNSVSITGTSGVAVATGLYYYLKKYCNVSVSWSGVQTKTASGTPPLVEDPSVVLLNDKFRYYENVCTASYSMVWWNWTRWEQEIDWMALNGINLPLAFNGQEEIWRRTFLKLGATPDQLDDFFSGPAFLAWQRMGNFRGFGGPLPESWHAQQVALQHRILKRMREFGMTPVLPAFAGHVPRAMEKLFPSTTMTRTCWQNFDDKYACPTFVYPNETLFVTIGKLFVQEYIKEFGTDHYYNADLFNELNPPSGNLTFVRHSGKAVYKALMEADPDAVWVMQGWLFISDPVFWTPKRAEALLTSVPQGKMLVLDLSSERLPAYKNLSMFYGQPFIWNMLLNYGGVLGLYGSLKSVNEGPFAARKANDSTMIGTGLTPEGINQNEVMFEFMNENAWRSAPVNISEWIENYALRRYGKANGNASSAWARLAGSVYDLEPSTLIKDHGQYAVVVRPSLHLKNKTWYDPSDVYAAWEDLLNAANDPDIAEQATFRYDLVDVTRQSLQLLFDNIYTQVRKSYWQKMKDKFRKFAGQMMDVLLDLDTLLASDSHFLLGTWLRDARDLGTTKEESDLYEYNARNQITLWGPKGEIRDYAAKQWSGLVRSYYLPRWELFLKSLQNSLEQHMPFNQTAFSKEVFEHVEEPFTFGQETYPTEPQGDSIDISGKLYRKYESLLV